MLEMAEATVNRLNVRGRQDLIRFAQTEVDEAEGKSRNAAMNLARFRNVSGLIDPERQADRPAPDDLQLQDELIASRNQLLQFRAFAPANPQVPVLRTKIAGLKRDIETELNKVAGGTRSLSAAAAQFNTFSLRAKSPTSSSPERSPDCRSSHEARRKQAYVERIAHLTARTLRSNRAACAVSSRRYLRSHCVRHRLHADGRHPRAPRLIMDSPASNGSWQRSLVIQIRVIWALILREILTR